MVATRSKSRRNVGDPLEKRPPRAIIEEANP